MKKTEQFILSTLLLIFSFNYSSAQSDSKISSSGIFAGRMIGTEHLKRGEIRKFNREFKNSHSVPAIFRFFSNRTFAPKLSVDLLDGKGIHLFSISEINALPAINVGARINAGIIITL